MNKNRIYIKIAIALSLSVSCALCLLYLIITNGANGITQFLKNGDDPIVTADPDVNPTEDPQPIVTDDPEKKDEKDDITSDDSIYRFINRKYPVDPAYVPAKLVLPLVPMYEKQYLIPEASAALEEMFETAEKEGIELKLISGYRSYQFQAELYDIYTSQRGRAYADSIDSYPGASEHQLGLAVDLAGMNDACELKECFDTEEAYRWLKENSYKFGYILRYPKDKENITGISFSPWAFRYIGRENALKIYNSDMTLEEYYDIG